MLSLKRMRAGAIITVGHSVFRFPVGLDKQDSTRRTSKLSQFCCIKIRRTTYVNYIELSDLPILVGYVTQHTESLSDKVTIIHYVAEDTKMAKNGGK